MGRRASLNETQWYLGWETPGTKDSSRFPPARSPHTSNLQILPKLGTDPSPHPTKKSSDWPSLSPKQEVDQLALKVLLLDPSCLLSWSVP